VLPWGTKFDCLLPPCAVVCSGKQTGIFARIVAAMQAWMMRVIQQHGFYGILMLASWPNAAFDLCGICCGAFLMPFWEFFGATLIGKGVIKVSGQSLFFVALFRCGAQGKWAPVEIVLGQLLRDQGQGCNQQELPVPMQLPEGLGCIRKALTPARSAWIAQALCRSQVALCTPPRSSHSGSSGCRPLVITRLFHMSLLPFGPLSLLRPVLRVLAP
jgi:hypothetical protein